MLTQQNIEQAARRLYEAEQNSTQMGHLSREFPEMTIQDAYQIQQQWVELKLAAGHVARGRKIGLTSKAMQNSSGISEPDYGVLLDHMFYEEGSDIPMRNFIVPRVEVELAFILGEDLSGPNCTVMDVLRATEFVVPAIEIIDARIQQVDPETGIPRKVQDTISDNAANAGIVLGGRPVGPMDIDLRWCSAICSRNGVVEETGVAAGVLGHPARGVAWLANKLHPYGVTLKAGEVMLGGSFTRPIAAVAGDTFNIDYGPLGAVGFRFV